MRVCFGHCKRPPNNTSQQVTGLWAWDSATVCLCVYKPVSTVVCVVNFALKCPGSTQVLEPLPGLGRDIYGGVDLIREHLVGPGLTVPLQPILFLCLIHGLVIALVGPAAI